ncbi:HlyD family efflux transporter periplasmic adaptor subunit [Sphingobacterium olei]|uniref:HlyD family efflux transporter periplasmic adaptor subunit n=1 Tax=Sphingobacterium olei TaxID=2571155 RepID=A0A4U0N885_9SPHI|nr:HlyD family efflux transporter periplasmic adaptor subunit [Sphingobacterium olei]TJZ50059.1 HlyD family efflux transporter periplasmic adaptor subunit [Sphingobacterium olei]
METEVTPEEFKNAERTEEVQAIIDRMPTRFGLRITLFVLALVTVFFSFGWFISYPDIVTGAITINASSAPVKLVAHTSGRLQFNNIRNFKEVKEGEYVGIIHNAADLDDVIKVGHLISEFRINDIKSFDKLALFPKNVSLGELSNKYFVFLNAFAQMAQYYQANLYDKQTEVLNKLIQEYKTILDITAHRIEMSKSNMGLVGKFSDRDSILFSKRVLSEADNERAKMTLISARDAYQNMLKEYANTNSQLQQTESQLQQTVIQKMEKKNQLELGLISAFTDLEDHFKMWEDKYVLKAPMDGRVQFLKFWVESEFVQSGEPIFTIVPLQTNVLGQMNLPIQGAGKVEIGQEVIIKLEDYPYMEYGSIKGIVSAISLTTNVQNTTKGAVENYLVNVSLPENLKTNYGSELGFRFETKGTGDIIVHQRRLIERLFDNLRYKLK